MTESSKSWNDYVTESIIAKAGYGIAEVKNIESVKDLYYSREQYDIILACIKTGNVDLIQQPKESKEGFREYLDIIKFTDQRGKSYFATVYDSDELWDNPGVLDIIPLDLP